MIDLTFALSDESITVDYRYEPSPFNRARRDHKIKMTRHHDGFIREKAIHEVLKMKPTEEIAAFCLVALADYVVGIGQAVVGGSSPELIRIMASVVGGNREATTLLENVMISYWNEYYRDDFILYTEYPPYKFLQSLKDKYT